jgi:hypothetical protein
MSDHLSTLECLQPEFPPHNADAHYLSCELEPGYLAPRILYAAVG